MGCFVLKKIICLILVFVVLSSNCVFAENGAVTVSSECDISDIDVPLSSQTVDAPIGQTLEIHAKSAILMEPVTGQILYEMNSDERLAPASITKIMPLLLIMEAIERGDISLETVVTASEHACSMGGSQIWLEPGESMTVDELLKATVIASANDACVALGELIAGSEEGFVAQMNIRAEELGMTNTNFVNCTGLDAEGHLTSAHDVAIMSCELIKHELIKKYSTVWMDTLRDGKSELVNTNKLVRFYEGTTGLKTGTTGIAKYCLSATAQRQGLSLVAVVMAGDTSPDRFEGAKKLLDYGFANYAFNVIDANLEQTELKVDGGVADKVKISAKAQLNVLLAKSSKEEIKRTYDLKEGIKAPVKKGQTVGYVNISVGDSDVGRIEITAEEDVKKLTTLVAFTTIVKQIFKL